MMYVFQDRTEKKKGSSQGLENVKEMMQLRLVNSEKLALLLTGLVQTRNQEFKSSPPWGSRNPATSPSIAAFRGLEEQEAVFRC